MPVRSWCCTVICPHTVAEMKSNPAIEVQAVSGQAAALNVLYIMLGAGAFLLAFNSTRQRGLLLRVGE